MIEITVNGEPREVVDGSTIADVVSSVVCASRGVAVSIDREVVPRSDWSSTLLEPGAHVEVLVAAAGG